jgi:hypothetical protein
VRQITKKRSQYSIKYLVGKHDQNTGRNKGRKGMKARKKEEGE